MPIEIRELIIKTSIVENSPSQVAERSALTKKEMEKLKQQLIESCTEHIIDRLNREKER